MTGYHHDTDPEVFDLAELVWLERQACPDVQYQCACGEWHRTADTCQRCRGRTDKRKNIFAYLRKSTALKQIGG